MALVKVCRQAETLEKIAYLNIDTYQVGSGSAADKQKKDMLSESLCHIPCHRLPKSHTASQPAGNGDQMMPPELRQMNPNFPSERRGVDVQMLSDPTASNRAAPAFSLPISASPASLFLVKGGTLGPAENISEPSRGAGTL
jgi:hypothetical protein